jgi:N-acetylglutamate synthase/N-acetylornithine aminotransferase
MQQLHNTLTQDPYLPMITAMYMCAATLLQITVDGDTSTNDTVIGLASGKSGAPLITDAASADGKTLEAALTALLQGLAKCIAWDGEGATCLMEIEVTGAANDADARTVAKSVAGSSLAKAAIFGHDPNWGRIAAAAGYSGKRAVPAEKQTTRGCLACSCRCASRKEMIWQSKLLLLLLYV